MNGYTYYNDNNSFCCDVLRKNINAGSLPEGYVDGRDIREVHATDFIRYNHAHLFAGIGVFPLGLSRANFPIHKRVLTGGFPCQDISNAGKRAGIEGERSGLWSEMDRLIQEAIALHLAFDYILVENVAALAHRGLSRVLADLTKAGYDTEWTTLRAADFGAPHLRERLFIVAYSQRPTSQQRYQSHMQRGWQDETQQTRVGSGNVAYPDRDRQRIGQNQQERGGECSGTSNLSNDGTQGTMANANSNPSGIRRRSNGQAGAQIGRGGKEMAYPDFQSLEVGNGCQSERRTLATSQQHGKGQFEPCLGRDTAWTTDWMDRYQWPARPGQQQYDWEPSRIITEKQQNRVARLKALGNAIVVPCVEYIGRCLVQREMDSVA